MTVRPRVRGKFIYLGEEKLYIRGVTYGPFRPDANGNEYHDPDVVDRDFTGMVEAGINVVRTYTVPPRWLLDLAHQHGLFVMVGIPWEQHITFLDDSSFARTIERRVRAGVRACAGHPAVLCYSIGNEIPAAIVRWHGPRRVERFLKRLYLAAKEADRGALVTYVNFPTTEYLQLPFLDFMCFNVYLESQGRYEAYLAHLQTIAGDLPLVMAEIGLDSQRNGEEAQAHVLAQQIRSTFAGGSAGIFVFAWTDEWHRGGNDIDDWGFGLTRRDRSAKPALAAVARVFAELPFPSDTPWPRISVVVCSYNGGRTIGSCCAGLQALRYPDYEVIVVDDGSRDATAAIAAEFGFRVIRTENRGLSSARNSGLSAATGEIVAYIDDDAWPDPDWLTYLAATFLRSDHVGVGGPNLPPPHDGFIADAVAASPGGPIHVLLSPEEAEHIPGCNMAFRREALEAIGGFDTQFRIAGDDVDICWRLQNQGWTLGFSAAAVVWHHRRNSIRAYLRQQRNYGKAEGALEAKWPERYNELGHASWSQRLYGVVPADARLLSRWRVYYGMWGSGLFQSIYSAPPSMPLVLMTMPEWYLVVVVLAAFSALAVIWPPLYGATALLALAVALPLGYTIGTVANLRLASPPRTRAARWWFRALILLLHVLQPLARLCGRLSWGLTPWRRRVLRFATPWYRRSRIWSEQWQELMARLTALERALRADCIVVRGSEYDRWDLEVRGGLFGSVRILATVEEHGDGRQLVCLRSWPRLRRVGAWLMLTLCIVASLAAHSGAWAAAAAMVGAALLLAGRAVEECAAATGAYLHALRSGPGTLIEGRQPRRGRGADQPAEAPLRAALDERALE